MITKLQGASEQGEQKGRIKIGKLQRHTETVKDLTTQDMKEVKGGLVVISIIAILIGMLIPEYKRP